MSANKIIHRLGYWTSRRHEDYKARDGLSRHSDWSRKLKRPRMGMVADLEEAKMGKKRRYIINDDDEEEDVNMNFVVTQDTGHSSDEDHHELVFRVDNEDYYVGDKEDIFSLESEDYAPSFKPVARKFHFNNLKSESDVTPAPSKCADENTEAIEMDNEADANDKSPLEEDLKSTEEQQEEISESVLGKIAALKRIDEKLLTIEREKSRKLKAALNSRRHDSNQNRSKKLQHRPLIQGSRGCTTERFRSRKVSSSSSISSSDSSSSDDSSSDQEAGDITRNVSSQDTDNLRNKLKLYLTKMKNKGAKKSKSS